MVLKPMRRIWAIGDVHGHANALTVLLASIELQPTDLVVFLGDYIDRGLDSKEVVRTVLEYVDKGHIALWGNHEAMAAQAYGFAAPGRPRTPESVDAFWPAHAGNGGLQTIASFGTTAPSGDVHDRQNVCPVSLAKLFSRLEGFYKTGNGPGQYEFVHAYARPGISLGELFAIPSTHIFEPAGADSALWQIPLPGDNDQDRLVIVGHVASKHDNLPYRRGHHLCIDTGAGYGGPVTALCLRPDLDHDQQLLAVQCWPDGTRRYLWSADSGQTWKESKTGE